MASKTLREKIADRQKNGKFISLTEKKEETLPPDTVKVLSWAHRIKS